MATIITKNSSTPSSVPTAGDLEQGELAVNVADKRLFTEDSTGSVVELGTNPSSFTASTVDIDGGTIDGVTIGGSTPAAGSFTTISATSDTTISGDLEVSGTNGFSLDGGTSYLSSPADNSLYFDGNVYGSFATFTTDINWRESHIQRSVSGNVTFSDTNKPTSGQSATIIIEIDYTSGTITWPAAWDWPGGTAPILNSGKNIICATVRDGTNVYAVKINSGAFS